MKRILFLLVLLLGALGANAQEATSLQVAPSDQVKYPDASQILNKTDPAPPIKTIKPAAPPLPTTKPLQSTHRVYQPLSVRHLMPKHWLMLFVPTVFRKKISTEKMLIKNA